MAKIALCAYCNTAVILQSWVGAVYNQPGAMSDAAVTDRPTPRNDSVNGYDVAKDTDTGELFDVPDFTTCRCGVTMAYYDDEDIAMVTPTCVVFGCDTDQLRLAIADTGPNPHKEVRMYRIAVPGSRTHVFSPSVLLGTPPG